MHARIPFRPLLLPIMILGLAGCAEFDWRKGPNPVIDPVSVQTASYNRAVILDALARDAGYGPGEPVNYYRVAEAGFNYVDDQCTQYFDSLFFINRGREQLKSELAATGATTAAILGVTHASAPSLAIVAAAFGLASATSDIVAGTYLYAIPPAATQGLVAKLQAEYRNAAATNPILINSPTAAYHAVQGYLSLCLPPRIEAEVAKRVSEAGAQVTSIGPGGIAVESTPLAVPSAVRPVVLLRSARAPLPPTKQLPTTPLPAGVLNNYERRLSPKQIREIQLTVCVKNPDGELGPVGSETRRNLVEFFDQFPRPRPSINSSGGGLTPKDVAILNDAFDAHPKGCLASGFKTPAEVGRSRT